MSYWVKLWEQFELLIRVNWVLVVCLFLDSWADSFVKFKGIIQPKIYIFNLLTHIVSNQYESCWSLAVALCDEQADFIGLVSIWYRISVKLYISLSYIIESKHHKHLFHCKKKKRKRDVMTQISWWVSLYSSIGFLKSLC